MAALRSQEDEYENMKKLLLLKKIQQEINGTDLMEEVATTKKMKENPLPSSTSATTSATRGTHRDRPPKKREDEEENEEESRKLRSLRRRRQRNAPSTDSFAPPPEDNPTTTHQQTSTTPASSFASPDMLLLDDDDNAHKQERNGAANSQKETVRAEPSSVFSELPSTKFYDTKLYDSQVRSMTSKEIDRELAALEKKHEESRFQLSDFLAEQLKRSYQLPSDYKPLSHKTPHDRNENSSTRTNTFNTIPNPITTPTNNITTTTAADHADLESALGGELDLGEENAGGGEPKPPPRQGSEAFDLLDRPKYLPTPLPYPELSSDFLLQSQARGVRPNSETRPNQFLDIVDIDKRAFGVGPIKLKDATSPIAARPGIKRGGATESAGPTMPTTEGMRRSVSVGEVPKRKPGGMNARLEALAQQLDQIEQSAYALQHDLAFSAKVVKNIDSEPGASSHNGLLQQEDAEPALPHPRTSHSLPSTPSSQSSPSSPRFPHHPAYSSFANPPPHQRPSQSQSQSQLQNQRNNNSSAAHQPHMFNQNTHQRIQDAMDLLHGKKGKPNTSSPAMNKGERSNSKRNETASERKVHHPQHPQHAHHDWLSGGDGNRDELSETQIQKLLSMSTLNATQSPDNNNDNDASLDWDLVEQILQD